MDGPQKEKTRNQRTSPIQSRHKKTSQNGDTNSSELMGTSDTTQNPQRNPSVAVTIAKAILHNIEPPQRASIYLSVVITLSLLADYWDTAKGSHLLYSSRDVLNQYFVKLGWGWTFSITGIFMLVTSFGRDKLLSWRLLMSLVRLAVGTGVWYCFAQALFPYVEHKSGICQETKHLDKRACRRAGFMWNGFDTSGHCFLLIWNCLFIVEESKAFINWETLKQYLAKEEEDLKKGRGKLRLSQPEQKELKRKYDAYIAWVEASFIVLSVFVSLWDFMTLNTVLFFHTFTEKVLGCLLAIFCWVVLYRFLYKLPLGPGVAGEGPIFKLYTKLGIRIQGKNCINM